MLCSLLAEKLSFRDISVSFDNVLDNAKASSGGERDVNFLKFLIDNKLLLQEEAYLTRTNIDFREETYMIKYKKMSHESTNHYLCRAILMEELEKLGIETLPGTDAGNMNILRSSANYDIAAKDLSFVMDIGLTPARNFFRGLTDTRVKYYLITSYFDDYMDHIIFCCLKRAKDEAFLDAVKDYEDGFKTFIPKESSATTGNFDFDTLSSNYGD
ncbi:hypothetical protein [Acetivibrio mesophilus]|uniref:Uncharacterized protein n=1 Tax=Acetivibrio mesophilus TaxID=2487273 RepID=A0A4Q0I699_9FIRM|nr:hypothetical protein [Acetivibrio mesophilus]RXE59913.1 hypothetical protein EFD62_03955 [Acetivibrio mesophilus]HHV29688.1 hypothetical protein [Clostridium sp.]